MNTNFTNFFNCAAKEPQNTGGGNSRHEALIIAEQFSQRYALRSEGAQQRVSESETRGVNHAIITQLSRNNHPITLRAIRYVAVLLMVFMVGIGNVWGDTTYKLFYGATKDVNGTTKNTEDFFNTCTPINVNYSLSDVNYTKAIKSVGTLTATAYNKNSDRYIRYDMKTTVAEVKIVAVVAANKSRKISYAQLKEPGTSTTASEFLTSGELSLTKNPSAESIEEYTLPEFTTTTNASIVFSVPSDVNDVQFLQITVVEKGIALSKPGDDGYAFRFQQGTSTSAGAGGRHGGGKATEVPYDEGKFICCLNSEHTSGTGAPAKISTKGTHYIKFTTSTASLVTVEVSSSKTFYINASKNPSAGNEGTAYTATAEDVEIAAGTWYIVPKGDGDVTIRKISFEAASGGGGGDTPTTYTVTYDGNGNTSGDEPTDSDSPYTTGSSVTVLGKGTLVKENCVFAGWNTAANGSGTWYDPSASFSMGSSNVTLYAQWAACINTLDFGTIAAGISSPDLAKTQSNLTSNNVKHVIAGSTRYDTSDGYQGLKFRNSGDWIGFGVAAGNSVTITTQTVNSGPAVTIDFASAATLSANTNKEYAADNDKARYFRVKAANGDAVVINKITIASSTPACSTPAVPDGLSAGSITSTGATFTITDDESPASYDIYYSTSSTEPIATTDASATTTSNTKEVTGLTANTTYYAWVRAVCDPSHKSDWVALSGGTFSTLPTYTVTYNTTGSDSGSAPSDATNYDSGSSVTVLGNTGSLTKSGYVFAGWNTASTLDGTDYAPGTKFNIGANTNLYPVWAEGTEETITYVVKTSSDASTTPSTHLTNLVNETNVGIVEVTDQTKSDRSGKYATSATEGYGVSFTFDVADGYTFHPTSIAIQLATVSTTDFTFYVTLEDADGTKLTSNALNTFSKDGVLTDVTFPAYDKTFVSGTVTMLVSATRTGGAAGTYRIGKTITIKGAVAEAAPASGNTITKASATNGTIAVTDGADAISSADEDDVVCIAATPNIGYGFTSWDVYKTSDATTKVTLAADDDDDNTTRKFSMPAYPVTVSATFTAINYTVTHSAATNGSYTIKVGDASAVSTDATANYGQTVTLDASPESGYSFAGWTVMQGETPVAVSNNSFTMPAGNVTVSAEFEEEPNVYYYKSASHYDGSAYKNPEGNAHDVALSDPWTILSGGTIAGVTSVVANGAVVDDKSGADEKWVTAYIKLESDNTAAKNVTFTIASGYLATIKMKIGAWSSTPNVYLKKSGTVQEYTGTVGGVATTENNFNEITWSDLTAGVYVLNVTSKNAYISQIDIQTTAVYTLIYDANGGTGTMENTVGTGTATLSTNTYTKSGCTFQGWATSQANANAGTVAYADGATNYNLSADATLYAVWKLNAPTISCAANVVTMSAMSGAAIYYTTDGETTPTSSSTLYNSSSKPQIAANTTFKAIAILENYVSSDVTTQTCEYVAPATVDDLVTIDADYTFTPSADITANTLTADSKFLAAGEGCTFKNGLLVKENRALAFKVNNGAKVKVTFTEKSDESIPREMQLGTAASDDDNKAYGHSGSSPAIFTVTADGVVYLTASKDLYMTKLEILYPHTVTYALGDGTGTLPTESAHYNGEQFYVHDGVTNITAPENKEFSVWSDGTSTYAGGAQYTMGSANVTLTAQWITALPLPTITFNDGAYTIGGSALNLSTLFTSNSDGAVTYTVKTAGETGATISGTNFTASAAGSATVTASQAATASYKAKSVDATITISAPSEVDGVKLVVDNALTGNFRCGRSLSDGSCTVAGISYSKYVTMGSTYTSWGPDAGPSNKYFSYTVQKKSTRFYFYLNNTGSAAKIHLYTSAEGSAAAATKNDIDVPAGTSLVTSDELVTTTNTEVFIGVNSTNIRFCQIVVVESGDSHLLAPAVGYAMSLNKGRLSTQSGTETTLDGITFVVSSGYKPAYSTTAQIGTKGTHYVSFTIPTGQTRQLQLTTSNTNKYTVSKTLGDAENQYQPKANNETKNWNLTAGTWYINPQGSNVNITNIAFDETPDPITVTFKDGASTLSEQALFAGDKVTEPSPAPTKDGYRFVGWQLSGSAYDFDDEVTEDITLDAVWQKVWTVTFDSDGGSDVAAATVDNGAAVAKPADPTKVGFDFVEWQLNSAAYNFASAVISNITLVATWEIAQTDASLSALSYNSIAIDVNSAVEIEGVQTYTVHLQWGSTVDDDLISVTKSAETATVSEISYDSENLKATFSVESGNHTVTINYAIQFVIDAKRGTSIVKAVVSGGDQKAGFVATGIYGDKGYAYTLNNKKLDTADKFVGVKLISGKTFASGDKLFVVTSTDADMGYIEIYEEAEGTNLIKATGVRDASEGIEVPELAGYSEFYIVRKASKGDQAWNGFVDYVEVTREMNPAIKSFKFGDDAATINEAAKTISIDVPYGTDVTALTPTIEAYGNNGATYTPEGATDFTSPVDYVVTDGYSEFQTTYAVTVNVAAPSENADLASLEVEGYALDFDAATTTYNIVLNYGTTVLPTITYEVADTESPATATKVEGGVNGATTITVTPQAGAGYNKVYTINFSVSTTPTFAVFDGRTMSEAVVSFTDPTSEMAWTSADASTSSSSNTKTINGRTYIKSVKIFGSETTESRYLKFIVPSTHVAKFYLAGSTNSSTGEQTLFFAKELTNDPTKAIAGITASVNDPKWVQTDYLLPGEYYFCVTGSARIYELSVTLYPIDYSREVTQGRYGTICLPNGGVMVGATIFKVAHMTYQNDKPYKVFFDEVINGVMEAGMPYIFMPKENATVMGVYYTDNVGVTAGNELDYNGLHGTLDYMDGEALYGKYIFSNNSIFMSENPNNWLNANRAYIVLSEVPDYITPVAPGCRRVSMGVNGTNTATGFENIEALDKPMKLMINGQIFIIRGEKMFDTTGRLVK